MGGALITSNTLAILTDVEPHRDDARRALDRAHADLALAFLREAKDARDDLRVVVMSATLDGARVAALLDGAPVVESEVRAFPVETRYLGRDARGIVERYGMDPRVLSDPESLVAPSQVADTFE